MWCSLAGPQLLKFALNETKDFYGYLTKAVEAAIEKGEDPVSIFSKKKAPATVTKTDKVKRKPSAFNIFMQKVLAYVAPILQQAQGTVSDVLKFASQTHKPHWKL